MENTITEEFKILNRLIGEFIKLAPIFPEEKFLAKEIGTSVGKMKGLIDDLIEENRKLKNE